MNYDNFYKPIEVFESMARVGIEIMNLGKDAGLDPSERVKTTMTNLLRCAFLEGCHQGVTMAHVKDN